MSACSNPAEFPWKAYQIDNLVLVQELAHNALYLMHTVGTTEKTQHLQAAIATLNDVIIHAQKELVRHECACHGTCSCHRS